MEFLDIYDKNGNSLGFSKSREEAHKEGLWHKIVCIFIVNSKKEIIMQRRSNVKPNNPNGWVCSASGHVDAGEDIETAALRELYEEIGVKATKDDLKHLGTVFEGRDIKEAEVKHISELFVIYKDVNIDDLILDKEEVSDAKYFKLEEIAKNNYAVRHSELFELFKKELERNN